MASVADILLHEADSLARLRAQRGEIWGGAIAGAGQAIGQGIAATQDPQRQLAQQRVKDLKDLDAAFAQPGGRDEILARVPGHLRSEVMDHFSRADEAAEKATTAQLAAERATNEYVYGLAQTIKANKYDPAATQLAFSHAKQTFAKNPSLRQQIDSFEQALHGNPTSEFVQSFTDPIIQAHEAQEKGVVIPQGGTLSRPTSGAVIATGQPKPPTQVEIAQRAAAGDPEAQKTMTALRPPTVGMTEIDLAKQAEAGDPVAAATLNRLKPKPRVPEAEQALDAYAKSLGKKDASELTDAERQAYVERGERQRSKVAIGQHAAERAYDIAHPTAADKLVKVEHKDPETGRTVIEYLPQSEVKGRTFQKGVGSTVEARLDSAQAVNQTGEDIIKQLRDPNIAAQVGPAMGRFNSLRDFIGNPPPELSEIAGSIESYSLANMGVHGMRSAQGAEQIKKMLDQKHTPESLIKAIQGLNKFSTHFMENEGRPVSGAGPKPTHRYNPETGKIEKIP